MERRRLPPLNALRAFEAAARHLNFSRAADELAVTPGAVSQQIQNLEDYVGAALFKRTPKGLLLTDAAQTALPALREAFDRLAEAASLLTAAVDGRRLTVTVAPSFAAKWLVPRLGRFEEQHPQVDVWLSAGMEVVDFASGEIDLAIRYGTGRYPGMEVIKLMSETVIPVASPAFLEANPLDSPSDLANHILLHDGSPDADDSCPDWAMWLAARGIRGRAAPNRDGGGFRLFRGPSQGEGPPAPGQGLRQLDHRRGGVARGRAPVDRQRRGDLDPPFKGRKFVPEGASLRPDRPLQIQTACSAPKIQAPSEGPAVLSASGLDITTSTRSNTTDQERQGPCPTLSGSGSGDFSAVGEQACSAACQIRPNPFRRVDPMLDLLRDCRRTAHDSQSGEEEPIREGVDSSGIADFRCCRNKRSGDGGPKRQGRIETWRTQRAMAHGRAQLRHCSGLAGPRIQRRLLYIAGIRMR
jgi:DNA-binding transcriptional LysR family regulator